jgi:hypothetical protein
LGDSVGGSRIRGRMGRLRVVVVGGKVGGRRMGKNEKRMRRGIGMGRIYQVRKGIG